LVTIRQNPELFSPRALRGAVHVWLARTTDDCDPAVLTPDERAASATFLHEIDARRAIVSRWLLRTVLSRYVPVDPSAWRFDRPPLARPEIAEPAGTGLRFNLSHTRAAVACAVTLDAAIGVDIESLSRDVDVDELAPSVCSPEEIERLNAADPRERVRRFLELWTLKEAHLKGRGVGLAGSPKEAGPAATNGDWWFSSVEVDGDHLLALAVERRSAPEHVVFFRNDPARTRPLHTHRDVRSTRVAR
jgi:4'-phosphopantetheinyl transferase